ncbi:uncharacterized protein LOC120359881 isoform X1 [Solenopsis invicta]|uniref:uncharacterized protein LOC120359881 isoform X1 n=1 Tax=Solenopsis invicta TaxID=13686 RepID=UPI00193DD5D6|nr:uncharacterized protein LOC120359881 isoform X1 [Solenopsis invicta]
MSRKPIFLVGSMRKQITGSKLPCQRDVLSVLFYNMREVKLNLHDSASLVIDECLIFWKKARIPTQDRSDCIKKCKKLYENFKKLGKLKTRASISCRQKEKEFEDSLNNLFDIAHANALDIIKINEDKEFLLMQRKNGRPGCMLGIDMKLTTAELKKAAQEEKELQRRRKQYCEIASTVHDYLSSFTDSSNESEMEIETDIPFSSQPGTSKSEEYAETETENNFSSSPKLSKSKRARKNILTARLSAALDRCKISDRDAVHILTACVDAINLNPQEFVINRTSIKTAREYYRKKISLDVKSKFYNLNLNFVVIHWDSKILPDITGKKNVDRLPVIATAPNVEQLLGVPELSSGTGREISSAVYDTLHEWSLLDIVQAVVFDTTASNTGRLKGACYLLEQKLDRDILFLACRHHIFEIVLQGVFDEIQLFPSKGPDVPLFKRFKNTWKDIDQTQYLTWLSDASVREMLKDDANEILLYAKKKIEEDLPRDDYQEFLELIIIFLGETPSRGIHFHQPGACHLARWMAKAIYCLKIYMFRQQFKLTHKEEKALRRICCFIIKCYAEAWFSAPNAIEAPLNDINFLKKLIAYKIDDKLVAEKAINKFINHLWYLNEECAAFSIFDERISDEERRDIAQKILLDRETNEADEKNDKEPEEMRKKLFIKLDDLEYFLNKDLPQEIITNNSKKLFGRFEISQDFLQLDPMHWKDQDSYKKGRKIINSLRVVNDTAERGVKLMEEFNSKFTYDESQKQFILQVCKISFLIFFQLFHLYCASIFVNFYYI